MTNNWGCTAVILGHLREGFKVTVHVGLKIEVEQVHFAPVRAIDRPLISVVEVMKHNVGGAPQGNGLSGRNGGAAGAIRAGKKSEVMIETSVLFHDENYVTDISNAARRCVRSCNVLRAAFDWRSLGIGNASHPQEGQARPQPHASGGEEAVEGKNEFR